MSINYFNDSPWWRCMANYTRGSDATAPDAMVKLISIESLRWWCMAKYKSCTDTTALDTRAKPWKSTTRHDDWAWPATVSDTDTTAPDNKAKTVIRMNCHNDDAWRTEGGCFGAALPDASARLPKDERNRTWYESEDIVECWELTSTWLARIKPGFNYGVRCEDELYRFSRRLTTTTLSICNASRYKL